MAKKQKIYWRTIFSWRSMGFMLTGVFFAVVGLQGFMVPNNFLDGGVTGISILVRGFADIHISILLIAFNLPFVILGFRKISRTFGIQALMATTLLSAGMYFIQIPALTNDKVLIAVFGGFLVGLGIGLVIRGGGVIDGLEVIAHYTEKRVAFSSSEIILVLNTLIIVGAAYRFGIEAGMYSLLVYFTAMKTTNYVVDGFEEFTALNIISSDADYVKSLIVNDFGKAITVYKGERGYLPGNFDQHSDCDIIVTVVTRLEIFRIREAITAHDPKAFMFVNSIKEVKGGVVKRK